MDILKYVPEFKVGSRHLVGIADLSEEDIYEFVYATKLFKQKFIAGESINNMKNKTFLMCFDKNSTRARIAYQLGIKQLGGEHINITREEAVFRNDDDCKNTAIMLHKSGFSAIVAEGFTNDELKKYASYSMAPVINVRSNSCSPCTAIADVFTILEKKGKINKLKLAIIGTLSPMSNSLLIAAAKCGMCINISCPKGFGPSEKSLSSAIQFSQVNTFETPEEAVKDVDVVYSFVDNNLKYESAEIKKAILKKYYANEKLMSYAKNDAIFLHACPSTRSDDATFSLLDSPRSAVYDQVENRIHATRAIYSLLLKNNK